MNKETQKETPLLTAMKEYVESNPIPFDVPGHKMGRLQNELINLIGKDVFKYDINAPIGMEIIYKNTGIIKKSSALFADAFNADNALYLINGTTSGIMTMIMSQIPSKTKIILPRNVHKSVINALIVSGAIPVFVNPTYDQYLGIANGVLLSEYIKAMDENPDAKAIFVINPTYFGIASSLKAIVKEAHKRNMLVLVDEAHGAHFHFHKKLPVSAMDAGADIACLSIHKTLGSLTQSSVLLTKGNRVDFKKIIKTYTMFGSTSPNQLLLASLEAARKLMVFNGKELIENTINLTNYAREKLNQIPGIQCIGPEYCKSQENKEFSFDNTRLVIVVRELNKTGFEIYHYIREKYNIQLELGETYLVLAILALGSTREDVDKLISAFKEISKNFYKPNVHKKIKKLHFTYADIACRPRLAYHAPSKIVKIKDALNGISSESIMIYPPGIPLVIPGEIITIDIIQIYKFYMGYKDAILQDSKIGYIKIIDQNIWYEKGEDKDEI